MSDISFFQSMPHYRERDLNCQAQNIAFALDFVNRVCDNYITASRNLGSDMMTKDRILEVLKYTPETGVFVWKISTGKAIAGRVAGQETKHGYVRITIDRRAYMAHRQSPGLALAGDRYRAAPSKPRPTGAALEISGRTSST